MDLISINIATLTATLDADVSGFSKAMQETEKRIEKISSGFKTAGTVLTAGLTLPLIGLGTAAIKSSMDFNKSMANVATLIPGNTKRVNELKTAVQDMAIATGKGTQDIANGLYQVISAFGDTADTTKILDTNVRAAAAGLATTTDAINLTSAVTKGYGDVTAEAVQKASDLAFQTVRLGQTTFPELAASIGTVVPLASNLKIAQEELFAVMATGTGVTGSASEVATQFRGSLQALMSPTDELTKLVEKSGFANAEAMVKQLGYGETMKRIVEAAKATNTPLQEYISSIEGQTLALALAGPQADTFNQKLSEMGKSAGATTQAFRDQTTGVNEAGHSWDLFKAKIEVASQKLGDELAPALTKITDNIQPLLDKTVDLVDKFSNLDAGTQQIIIGAAGLAVALGPLISILGGVIGVGRALIPVFTAVGGVIAGISTPVLIAIGIIAALVTAGILLWKNWDTVKTRLAQIWESIKQTASEKIALITKFFSELPGKIVSFISSLPEKMAYWFGYAIGSAIRIVSEGIPKVIEWFETLPDKIADYLSNLYTRAKKAWEDIKTAMIDLASSAVEKAVDFFEELPEKIMGFISSLPGKLYRKALDIASSFWRGFQNGLGINSPSYVEVAFANIAESAFASLAAVKQATKGIGSAISVPKIEPLTLGLNMPSMPALSVAGGGSVPTFSGRSGNPIYINITGNTISNDYDIKKIGEQLVRQLKREGVLV